MKKLLFLALAGVTLMSTVACSNQTGNTVTTNQEQGISNEGNEVAQTVKLMTKNGAGEMVEVEFPYNPQRIAVMDLAALDILDAIGYADRIVGVSKGSSIDYLSEYVNNDNLIHLGTVKEADMEAVMSCEPEVIFIGGRMASVYDELSKIAPVYMVSTDTTTGVIESIKTNTQNIASLFGIEEQVQNITDDYQSRIEALKAVAKDKTAIIGMVNAGGFGLLGNDGRCSIIGKEIGFENVGIDAKDSTSSHGNDASFEFILEKNPDYIFIMDRDAAIGTNGAKLAAEVMNNDIVNKTDAAQNGRLIILEHPNVWYTAEGGIKALDVMLQDLETALLN